MEIGNIISLYKSTIYHEQIFSNYGTEISLFSLHRYSVLLKIYLKIVFYKYLIILV